MKRKYIAAVIGILFIFVYFALVPVSTRTLNMYVEVNDYVGIIADNDAIYFGTVLQGGTSKRDITIYHDFRFPKKVNLKVVGDMANQVELSENNFWLEPYINKKVEVLIRIPKNQEFGNYTSKLKIKFNNL